MRIDGIDVVFFWVDDLDTSVAWYTEVLGLNAGPRYGDWQEFAVDGGTRFALHGGRLAGGPATAAVAFNTPDLRAAIDEMAARGAVPIDEVTKHCLLEGLDQIALTMQHDDEIAGFEGHRPAFKPETAGL